MASGANTAEHLSDQLVADVATLTSLISHFPKRYDDFVRETAAEWSK